MRNWKSIANAFFWLLLALPVLFPAPLRPHVHLDAHPTEASANHQDDCALCDAPILMVLPSHFHVAAPVALVFITATAAGIPDWESPHVLLCGSRAPPDWS